MILFLVTILSSKVKGKVKSAFGPKLPIRLELIPVSVALFYFYFILLTSPDFLAGKPQQRRPITAVP